ncbi:MAG: DUF4197 domain-containing protein [Pseudomonadota bacterium]
MRFIYIILLLCIASPTHAGWSDLLDIFIKDESDNTSINNLSQQDVIAGLKQALSKGSEFAVNSLGKQNGFLNSEQFKIPMPEQLAQVESVLRKLRQDELADEFVFSMNRAAEQALPVAGDILKNIVSNMSVEDAYGILKGPDNAATNYLQKKGGQELNQQFLPIVKQTTDKTGVTRQYKTMQDKLGMLSSIVDMETIDIDQYVTDKAVAALFTLVAEQEKLIREDPLSRTTELMKKVFAQQ